MKKILFIAMLLLSGFAGFYVAKVQSAVDSTLGLLNHDVKDQLSKVDLSGIKLNSDEEIVNILIIGVDNEALGDTGRSDSTMIATLDKKHKRLKVTSLMRDMYVEIPGHGMDKLNAAYAYNGVPLLYETIAKNFGIRLDGYVELDFSAFVKVVNAIGGVEIELTEREANYLNTTNYISKKKYRKVKSGKHKLNGYQALGYSRVRYVETGNGLRDDYGRTYRQRVVMQNVFLKIKTMPMSQWMEIAKIVFPEVTTDLSNDKIISYSKDIMMMGTTQLDKLQIPAEGAFTPIRTAGGADVLQIDVEKNTDALQDFLLKYDGK